MISQLLRTKLSVIEFKRVSNCMSFIHIEKNVDIGCIFGVHRLVLVLG